MPKKHLPVSYFPDSYVKCWGNGVLILDGADVFSAQMCRGGATVICATI